MSWPQQPQPPHGQPQYSQRPQYPQQPHYPQQPQYAPPLQPQYGYYQQPREGIVVTAAYMPLSWMFAMVKPKIFVNGREMPTMGWGRTVVPAPPGQYHVHVHTPYFLPSRVGSADHAIVVQPGQWVELEYKVPVWTFSPGSLGPPPQTYNGQTAMMIVSIVAVVLVFAAMLALAVSA
jgi:hypothetical protein